MLLGIILTEIVSRFIRYMRVCVYWYTMFINLL